MPSEQNPKLAGSNIIDCIPQTGKCPNGCEGCFYNEGFYRPLDEPLLPTVNEVGDRIVRVNSGHDSNLEREKVLAATAQYPHRFYNTNMPMFDFPAPVVFTCNGREPLFVDVPANVMAVRVRCNSWGLLEQEQLILHYSAQGVPVVVTWMRYAFDAAIPALHRVFYEKGKHVTNEYWMVTSLLWRAVAAYFAGKGVRYCGTPWSSACADCRNCEFLYWDCVRRMKGSER